MKKNKLLLVSSLVFIISYVILFFFAVGTALSPEYVSAFFFQFFTTADGLPLKMVTFIFNWSFIYFPLAGLIGLVFNGKKRGTMVPIVFGVISMLYAIIAIILYHIVLSTALSYYSPLFILYILSLILGILYLIGGVQNKKRIDENKRDTMK